MNRIPNTYKSNLSISETHELISKIKRELKDKLIDNLNIVEIKQAMYSRTRPATESKVLKDGRPITFDSVGDNSVYYILNDFALWMMNSLIKLNIKTNGGVISELKYIDRDVKISNTRSFEKNILSIEYLYDNAENIVEKARELTDSVYRIVHSTINGILTSNEAIKAKPIPIRLKTVEIDSYEDVLESNEANDVVRQQGVAIVYKKLDDKQIFEAKEKTYVLFFEKKAFVQDILIEATIRKGINELPEQLNLVVQSEMDIIKSVISDNWKSSINISINLDHIAMIALNKSHILEVQSGIHSEEIEDFLIGKGIEHL